MALPHGIAAAFDAYTAKDWTKAIEAARRLEHQPQSRAGASYLLGLVALEQDQPQQALAYLQTAATFGPPSPALQFARARCYVMIGENENALRHFSAVLAESADHSAALDGMTRTLLRLDRPAEAIPYLARLTKLTPQDEAAWLNLGLAQRDIGDHAAAQESLSAGAVHHPSHPGLHRTLGLVSLELGQADAALAALRTALAANPTDHEIVRLTSLALIETGHYPAALALIEAALAEAGATAERLSIYATIQRKMGDQLGALQSLMTATQLAPNDPALWLAGGEAALAADQPDRARDAFVKALQLDPDDRSGAGLRLARLTDNVPAVSSAAHIEHLFDQFAPRFDAALTGKLSYQAPQLIRNAVQSLIGADFASPWKILDLGCGTGLGAFACKDVAEFIDGIDLSAAMLHLAAKRGLYRELRKGDAVILMAAMAAASYDLIIAADMVVYLGELAPLFSAAYRVLQPGSGFVFTAEALAEISGEEPAIGFALTDRFRYAHSKTYLAATLAKADFSVIDMNAVNLRLEAGDPVKGWCVAARKPAISKDD